MGATSLTEAAQNVERYSLIEKIGEGYLGPVYRGFDQDMGTPVVIRILCDGIRWDTNVEELFSREMRAVEGLQHPNIARILGHGKEGSTHYIAMESLGSGTLGNLIAQNSSVPVEKKLSIMIQISEGLSHAHKKGVLHRDLVPGKIHLAPDGTAKIRDFAVAQALMKYLPRPAVRWGVPIYLCPEQIQHDKCDQRSDIFSLGTIFYELITHCHPFHDKDSNKALDNIIADTPIPTFEKFPDAPPGIWTILKTCLSRNPEDRYQSAEELASECRQLLVSIAEDAQLVLSELYASLSPLRKAAALPNASPDTVRLMDDIQRLLRGERESDYAYLDQLMNRLMEQYPSIQAAANAPPSLDSLCPQLPPEEPEISLSSDLDSAIRANSMDPQPPSPEKTFMESSAEPPAAMDFFAAVSEEPSPIPEFIARDDIALPLDTALDLPVSEQPKELESELTVEAPVQPAPLPHPVDAKTESPHETPAAKTPESPAPPPLPVAAPTGSMEVSHPPQEPFEADKVQEPAMEAQPGKGAKPSYRFAVVLLSILVISTAGYIVLCTEVAASIRNAWNIGLPYSTNLLQRFAPSRWNVLSNKAAGDTTSKAKENLPDTAESQKQNSAAGEVVEPSLNENPAPLEATTARIHALLNSGNLQMAKSEIDRLQTTNPEAAQGLRKRWQALVNARLLQEQGRKDEEQQKTMLRQKEEDWTRQLSEFLAHGKYGEASGALSLWLAENPGSARAQDLSAKVQEIQRQLKSYSTAMAENHYTEALNALGNAEKLNPADSSLADMRRQAETRKAAARATLTIHRLGPKATLLLDGKPIGRDGELDNESVSIGNHTLAIENGGGTIASRIQEYSEGQHVVLVYDSVKQTVRTMTDSDKEMIAQRKASEEIERFTLDHDHGVFRGMCRGVLSLSSLDVAFSPSSGSHGFRIPFKLLKLKTDGKNINFYNISDDSHFQTFRFPDAQSAYKFRQKWDELKALAH